MHSADVDGILALIVNHGVPLYPQMRADIRKLRKLVIEAISAAQNFCWVAEADGKVSGVIVGFTGDNLWAERKHCLIPLWISLTPGDGAALLREFRTWVAGRPIVKVSGFAPDIDVDDRVWKLAERIGFERHGGAFLRYS